MTRGAYLGAVEDFHEARRRAALEQILARLTGRPDTLLSYDEVRSIVGERNRIDRGLKEIPLDAIVGSVGRYGDFTRTFLPKSDQMQDRWARVKTVATSMEGWPPIEVYQLGESYFVIDGNHRVSVARQMGLESIPAYVTEVKTRVPLTPDAQPEELIIRARHADFLKRTGLGETRPEAALPLTQAGNYRTLEEHIRVHRHYMGIEQQREIPYEEAAAHWYDTVYRPVANIIREQGLLQDFPDRTETDLYLWLAEHRAELEEALGWEVPPHQAAEDLAVQRGGARQRVLTRVSEKLIDAFTPEELEPGPAPGEWRVRRLAGREEDHLFSEILVALNGRDGGWRALEQAIVIAQREGALLRGLHVVPNSSEADKPALQEIRDRFAWRMGEVQLNGKLVVEEGPVARTVCDRARWNDLVVMPLTYPPGPRVLERLGSGVRTIVQRCPRPLLTGPGEPSPMQRALLAYDGSPKADEALYVATYLAVRWEVEVVVLTALENGLTARYSAPRTGSRNASARAQAYLEAHGVEATYEVRSGDLGENIMKALEGYACDFILMGGYGRRPVFEIMLGSGLNEVLRTAGTPVLICR